MIADKVAVICLFLLATKVQCSQYSRSTVYMKFPPDVNVHLGSGHKENYLPILAWKTAYDPFQVVKCSVYTRDHDKCDFNLNLAEGTDQVDMIKIHQLSAKKLTIAWMELRDETIDQLRYYTKFTTIDMNNCSTSTKTLQSAQAGTMVKSYADSFDLFSTSKYDKNVTRTSYDIEGNKKAESVNMFFDSDSFFRIFPATIESPEKGFFIFTLLDGNGKLSFVEPNGKEIKRLAVFDGLKVSKVVSGLDHSIRVICWAGFDKEDYTECAQFLDTGKELWRNRTSSSHGDEPFYAHNLMGDGIIFVSLKYGNEIQVIEMQSDADTLKSTYPANFELLSNNVKVVDFNQTDRTFMIFWVTRGSTGNDVMLAKYAFPSKFQKNP